MFKNMGLHTIKCPTGKFAYVGSIPVALAEIVEASTSDVMGGRAWTDEATGKIVTTKFPVFDTNEAAV